MDLVELYDQKRESFFRKTLLSSGVSLLLAAGSRLPAWEVGSPVGR